jgi:hypothetical protein
MFTVVVGGLTLVTVVVATVAAMVRARRTARPWQYGLTAVALVTAGSYVGLTGSADPAVLVVEAFHFVQYGAITWLFYACGDTARRIRRGMLPRASSPGWSKSGISGSAGARRGCATCSTASRSAVHSPSRCRGAARSADGRRRQVFGEDSPWPCSPSPPSSTSSTSACGS